MKEKFLNELIQELSNHGFVNSQLTEIKKNNNFKIRNIYFRTKNRK